MTWYVSYQGEIVEADEKPQVKGWSSLVAPENVPPNYHPEQGDIMLHMVMAPDGSPCYVKVVLQEGRWVSLGVLSEDDVTELVSDSRETWGVGNSEGKPSGLERWK